MLSQLVGTVDGNAAFVLVAIVAAIGVIATALIAKRRSRLQINNDFELAKLKQQTEAAAAQFSLETDRAYKFKQIEEKLLTSHQVLEDKETRRRNSG